MRPEDARGPGRSLAPLIGHLRTYAWGSHRFLAELEGRPVPSAEPEAERWFGAHPDGPATIVRDGRPRGLDSVIAADPEGELGEGLVARSGARLPFLVKILAAAHPLSIQAHPDAAAAAAGHAAEEAAGIAPDDPRRTYRDPWAKPEVITALTPLRTRSGLRDATTLARVLATFAPSALAPERARLEAEGDAAVGDLLAVLLEADPRRSERIVAEVVASAAALVRDTADAGALGVPEDAALVTELVAHGRTDIGVVVALLLNPVTLAPGESLAVPAGVIHLHLGGAGIEVMASSDNVVRAGLTDKHVDRAALLAIAVLDPTPPLRPRVAREGAWEVLDAEEPAAVSAWSRVRGGDVDLTGPAGTSPAILVCVEGEVVLSSGEDRVVLTPGAGAFLSARADGVRAAGEGTIVRASPGRQSATDASGALAGSG